MHAHTCTHTHTADVHAHAHGHILAHTLAHAQAHAPRTNTDTGMAPTHPWAAGDTHVDWRRLVTSASSVFSRFLRLFTSSPGSPSIAATARQSTRRLQQSRTSGETEHGRNTEPHSPAIDPTACGGERHRRHEPQTQDISVSCTRASPRPPRPHDPQSA